MSQNFKSRSGEGGFRGLMDVETGGVSGLEDELVCSFRLAADVVRGGVW